MSVDLGSIRGNSLERGTVHLGDGSIGGASVGKGTRVFVFFVGEGSVDSVVLDGVGEVLEMLDVGSDVCSEEEVFTESTAGTTTGATA